MGHGFGFSEEDVYSVLLSKDIPVEEHAIHDLTKSLDGNAIEKAALNASDDLDEQTIAAYEEIWRQLQSSDLVRAILASQTAAALDEGLPQAPHAPPKPRM